MAQTQVVRELLTLLGFQIDKKAYDEAEKKFKKLKDIAEGVAKGFAVIGGTIAAVGTGLFLLAKHAADVGDEARDTGFKLGLTAEQVQQLTFVAEQSGSTIGAYATNIRALTRTLNEARTKGGQAAGAFRTLFGENFKANLAGKDAIEIFKLTAEKLAAIKDPLRRNALLLKIYGRNGVELAPLFAEGAAGVRALFDEAQQLGDMLSDVDAKAADAFNDSLNRMKHEINGVFVRLGIALIPAFKKLAIAVTDLLVKNKKLIDSGIKTLAGAFDTLVSSGLKVIRFLAEHKMWLEILAATITWLLIPKLTTLLFAAIDTGIAMGGAALAAIGPWVAFGLGILFLTAVFEDLFAFVSGKESLIGHLFDAFINERNDPKNHWVVRTLGDILWSLREAIRLTDEFFDKLFNNPLGVLKDRLIDVATFGQLPLIKAVGNFVEDRPDLPSGAPVLSPSIARGGGGDLPTISSPISVTVEAVPSDKAQETADRAVEGLDAALERRNREAARRLEPRGLR